MRQTCPFMCTVLTARMSQVWSLRAFAGFRCGVSCPQWVNFRGTNLSLHPSKFQCCHSLYSLILRTTLTHLYHLSAFSFLRASAISSDVTDFVERFTGTGVDVITVPREIPGWLWGGSVTFRRHPVQLRLKFLNPEIFADEEREAKERVAMGGGGGAGVGVGGVGGVASGEGSGNRWRGRWREGEHFFYLVQEILLWKLVEIYNNTFLTLLIPIYLIQ